MQCNTSVNTLANNRTYIYSSSFLTVDHFHFTVSDVSVTRNNVLCYILCQLFLFSFKVLLISLNCYCLGAGSRNCLSNRIRAMYGVCFLFAPIGSFSTRPFRLSTRSFVCNELFKNMQIHGSNKYFKQINKSK